MIRGNRNYVFLDEKRHSILDSVNDATSIALKLASPVAQPAVTCRAANNVGDGFIHSI
jgi:hypothetical protein